MNTTKELQAIFRDLKFNAIPEVYAAHRKAAETDGMSYDEFLHRLLLSEQEDRRERKVRRLLHQSRLPVGKTLSSLDSTRLPVSVQRKMKGLMDGGFLARKENVLVFGKPGCGKTHLACAIAHELVLQGHRVVFMTAQMLVQDLLVAKRDLWLRKQIRRLACFEAVIIDDIGYVQQSREEMEVLFTLIAERYETGSVILTSNLAFSKWDALFKDPMTTAAAIDRLVHHSIIVELNLPSYRMEAARQTKERG